MRILQRLRAVFGERKPTARDYHRSIESPEAGNALIASRLATSEPFFAGRLGAVELAAIRHLMLKRWPGKARYPREVADSMVLNAGFFPATDGDLDRFGREYLRLLPLADVLAVWLNPHEQVLARDYCPAARLVAPRALEPYYHSDPWSRGLEGQRVLVIHPFAESITESYARNRARLFTSPSVLPQFELTVLRAVQSIAGARSDHATWFDALAWMKDEMDKRAYDVCLIGAGAYGFPLAAHAKERGRKAILMGGATQILFGIKGKRWDNHPLIARMYNDAWVRPRESERPEGHQRVEDGCYW